MWFALWDWAPHDLSFLMIVLNHLCYGFVVLGGCWCVVGVSDW